MLPALQMCGGEEDGRGNTQDIRRVNYLGIVKPTPYLSQNEVK
jgi:hypothetical protein